MKTHQAPSGLGILPTRRGAIIVIVAVSLVGLIGMLVLALDVGAMQRQKKMIQAAADAGAMGAAVELWRNRPESVFVAAYNESARNGFTNGAAGTSVTPTWPTTTGTFVGADFVHVVVQKSVPTIFAGFFGFNTTLVRAEAVAGIAPSKSCLFVLNPTGTTLSVPNGTLTASSCSIKVNSNDNNSVDVGNNGTIIAQAVETVGGISGGSGITGTKITGAPLAYNPLAVITMPTLDLTCDFTNKDVSGTETLVPGTYCGGIEVSGAGSTANMTPGLYVLRGGQGGNSLEVKANATLTSNGNGVTIIITGDGTWPYMPVNFQANSIVNLTADIDPTNPLKGIVIYQDPSAPAGLNNELHAGAGSVINGTIYFPTQNVDLGGGSSTVINGSLAAGSVSLQGNSTNVTINGGASPSYLAIKRATIVE